MKKGQRLRHGDTIGIIAPSGPADTEVIERAKKDLEKLGYRVKLGQTCFASLGGYLAGSATFRAKELQLMFQDNEVNAIMCLRGGYGSVQLLQLLDYKLLAKHPKLFIGYSDITALHIALQQQAKLVTIHGPNALPSVLELQQLSKNCLMRTIMQAHPLGAVKNPPGKKLMCLVAGRTEGMIVGGNLSLIAATMGTPYEINTKGKLLFIEDVNEELYRIDRMLTQLALGGKFSDANGIIIGSWEGCHSTIGLDKYQLIDLFINIIAPFNKPTIYNLQSGHDRWNMTLPFGINAHLDATNCQLMLKESAVI